MTITQQGFLNAIVYGWTREDFLSLMAVKSGGKGLHETELSSSDTEEEVMEGGEDQSARRRTASKEEHTFTHSMLDTDYSNSDLEESK